MRHVRTFEELWTWQQVRDLVRAVYADLCEGTPGYEDSAFRGALQGAVLTLMNSLAEGFMRLSETGFDRSLDLARGACGVLVSMYYPAEDLGYVPSHVACRRRSSGRRIAADLERLRHSARAGEDACVAGGDSAAPDGAAA